MRQFKKEGVIHTLGAPMSHPEKEGFQINPNEQWLTENGWEEIVVESAEIVEPTSAELRKELYATQPLIEWEGEIVTIDQANALFNAYLAEGNSQIATTLSGIIATTKAAIREQYSE